MFLFGAEKLFGFIFEKFFIFLLCFFEHLFEEFECFGVVNQSAEKYMQDLLMVFHRRLFTHLVMDGLVRRGHDHFAHYFE